MFDPDRPRRRGPSCLECLLAAARRPSRKGRWAARLGTVAALTAGSVLFQTTAVPDLEGVISPTHAPASMQPAAAATPVADPAPPPPPVTAAAYWLASSDGGVFSFGSAAYLGGPPGNALRSPLVAMAATPTARGYWVVAGDGGVFAYGDAPFEGSAGNLPLTGRVVGIAPTPTGRGYWLVAADGGVFAFGDAGYYGSVGNTQLNQRIVGIAATASGRGYWLAGADGGVFAFGDAAYRGSVAGAALNQPVVSVAATPDGGGYWLVARDGGVFAFGDAPFFGSSAQGAVHDVASIAPTFSGKGYWLVARDGGVFAYGDAEFYGSVEDLNLNAPVIGISARVATVGSGGPARHVPAPRPAPAPAPSPPPAPAPAPRPAPGPPPGTGPMGYDVSWPQCGQPLPASPTTYGVVGVTNGYALSNNPCLADEWRWARAAGGRSGLYVNVSYPGSSQWGAAGTGLAGTCAPGDLGCELYNFGANTVQGAVAYARQSGADSPMWWMDVETANPWPSDTGANSRVVAGAIDEFRQLGLKVGIYSTPYQWSQIVGSFQPGLPVWTAGAGSPDSVPDYCQNRGFGGGVPYLVQLAQEATDTNFLCPPGERGDAFR